MESPWAPAGDEPHFGIRGLRGGQTRSSLGLLIERSTSAPPMSSSGFIDSFAYAENGYAGHENLGEDGPIDDLFPSSRNGEAEYSVVLPEDRVSQLDSGSIQYLGEELMNLSIPPSARPFSENESVGSDGHFDDRSTSTESLKHLRISPLDGLVRSKSAAPAMHGARSMLGPPPGLHYSSSSESSESYMRGMGQQRPASTGGIPGPGTALRPSAKTLMDLIQEDFPPESYSPDQDYVHHSQRNRPPDTQRPQGGMYPPDYAATTPSQYQGQGREPSYVVSNHQQYYQPQSQSFVSDPYHQKLVHQVQGQRRSPPLASLQQPHDLYSNTRVEDHLRVQQTSPQGPIYHPHQPQQQQHHHQRQQEMVVLQQQQIQPPNPQRTLQFDTQQQNVYYVQEDPHHQPHLQQRVTMQYSHPPVQPMQQQVMTTASGQTVYVTTSPPPNYGYSTMQYQQSTPLVGEQHRQIIQHAVGSNDQYVSVVPTQGSRGPQVSYWQPDGHVMAAAAPTVAIINGQQVTMQHVGGGGSPDHGQHQLLHHPHHALREPKTGRGGGRGGRVSSRRADSKGHPAGSPLLNEYRANKSGHWTIHQIVGHVVEFCQDQNGSRFIQQRLELRDVEEQLLVVNEVLPAIRSLRNDVFGNYVVQKLLDFGSSDVKAAICETIKGEMIELSFQMYGCRVVQKALEGVSERDLPSLLSEFQHNVLSCIHDQNGNHVIQKCIEVVCARLKRRRSQSDSLSDEHIDFIIRDVLVNATSLSCHPYGCRVLQRILEHCDDKRKFLVLDEIMKSHRKLLDDQYGNYVIQHVLQYGRDCDRDSILGIIVDSGLLGLSRQKFASNVVEKLLKYGNSHQRRAVVREMLKKGDDPSVNSHVIPGDQGSSVVVLMVRDAYANYVVQTALDVMPESEEKRLFLRELSSHSDELRQYTFAKHIVAKLQTMTIT